LRKDDVYSVPVPPHNLQSETRYCSRGGIPQCWIVLAARYAILCADQWTWLGDDDARLGFLHYVTLHILGEFGKSLRSISRSNFEKGTLDLLDWPVPEALTPYFQGQVKSLADIPAFVRRQLAVFELWVQNPKTERPIFLTLASILNGLAEHLADRSARLQDVFFRVFIDEFENLQAPQQRLISDHIKHPGQCF
jgi:hypothetical protein